MKILSYIKYFFYIAFNWDVKIAWHIIKQEIKGEKKYGINTTGADELKKLNKKGIDISHATIYMPVSYKLLEEAFNHLNTKPLTSKPLNHFVDIGCGKGRALCIAAHQGFIKVTGIDFSKEFCDQSKLNLEQTKKTIPTLNFSIISNDAFYFEIPADADCIFFFNPFDEIIMSGVVTNILNSLRKNSRKISIIYINPMHKKLFTNAGFKEIWHSKKMEYLEVVILEN